MEKALKEITAETEFEEWFFEIMSEEQIHPDNWPDHYEQQKEAYNAKKY